MQTVLIVIHLMIVLALVVVVLLQKSEGGALGIGGGGGFMSGRGQANPLSRLTAYLAAGFFATSIALTIIAGYGGGSVFDRLSPSANTPQPAAAPGSPNAPLGSGKGGILPSLKPAGGEQKGQGAGAPPQPEGSPPAPDADQPKFDAPPAPADEQPKQGAGQPPAPQQAQPAAPAQENAAPQPAQPSPPSGAPQEQPKPQQ